MSGERERLEYDNRDLESYYLFNEGTQFDSYTTMGCKRVEDGYVFTVWAPNAKAVYLVGDFNDWAELDEMEKVEETGMFIIKDNRPVKGDCYKYKVIQA